MESAGQSDIISQIESLIAVDQLADACTLLTSTRLKKQALALQGRLQDLINSNHSGILERREYEVARNKIRNDLLALVDQLDGKKTGVNRKNLRILLWAAGAVLLIGIIWGARTYKKVDKENYSIFDNDSAYHILLLPFGPDGDCTLESNQYHWPVQRRIEELNRSENLGLEVQRQDTIMCDVLKANSIRTYGRKLGADLVIYGNYQERCEWDTTLLYIRYILVDTTISVSPFSKEGTSKHFVHDDKSLVELSSGKLTGNVEDVMYWTLGMREYDQHRYAQSIWYLEKVTSSVPNREQAIILTMLGNNKYYLSDHEASIHDYSLAIQLDPNEAIAYINRGVAYYYLKQYEHAISDYEQAIQLAPKDAIAYIYRGVAYSSLKQYESAISDFEQAIQLKPNKANAYYERGVTYYYLKQYEHAISDFEQVIQLDPNNAKAYVYRGIVYKNLKQYEHAISDYEQAIQLDPNNAKAYINRGIVYKNLKQYEHAISDYEQAIQLAPKDAIAYNNRGVAFAILKQYERAIADFNQAIQLRPNDTFAIKYRELAHEKLNEQENKN